MTHSHTIDPYLNKQLFLDDGAIHHTYGLRRVLNRPDRMGPVLRPDRYVFGVVEEEWDLARRRQA